MSRGLIGVSAAENARFSSFYASLVGLERPADTISMFSTSAVISQNRNKITEEALRQGVDWVLYLDDDQILQPDTLLKLLDTGHDVISAHYIQRQHPFNSVLMRQFNSGVTWHQLEPTDRGIVEVEASGAGCLLVRRNVLEALKPPYWTIGQIDPASWGDDIWFCKQIRNAGFKVYCDLENQIGHIMTSFVFPRHEDDRGWVANMVQNSSGIIAKWSMPMFGDDLDNKQAK